MSVYDLWLPIILAGIATHVLSTIAWMLLPHHKPEWKKLPVEDEFQAWVEAKSIPPGQYLFPMADTPSEMKGEDYLQRETKCKGTLVLWGKPSNMAAAVGQTLAFFMVAAFVIGYLASLALPAGASFSRVIQFVMTAGLLTHVAAKFPHVFWFRRHVAMEVVDGIAYAIATGLIFALMWPAA